MERTSLKSVAIFIRVSPEMRKWTENRAAELDRSVPDYIRHLISSDRRRELEKSAP